ncbi:PfkB family carbohydrate kinase [Demequina lignilytica]|uniref:PfkB family carbohydrate kinase n=1 Tax=Demequina lignilytica TaxID=3051663 RepID=UPI00345E11C5
MTRPGDAAYLSTQRADLLRFLPAAQAPGGFGWLDEEGVIDPSHPVELWITCRMTHVAALGALADEPAAAGGPDRDALLALAAHGVAALADGPLHDDAHGGWFAAVVDGAPTVTTKQAYGHAFVVLAASSATAAGVPGAEALLAEALAVSERRFWDDAEGLSVEEWDAAWTTLDPYRGINANMHTVEAYLAAGDVTGDAVWHERAGRIAARVASWAAANDWRIPEHFDADWSPMLEFNRDEPAHPFRPYGATVGHGLEWARLLVDADATLGERAPAGLTAAAVALYDRAVSDGWDADGAAGFVYTTGWDGTPVVRERMHWVLAEAVNAAQALGLATGDDRYADDAAAWWGYADEHLIDHARGSWHHELDVANRPAGTVWPGKPDLYHAYQAALLPELPLVPSFATALRDGGPLGTAILTVGECVLDVVRMPDGTEAAHAGGSPANVAVGLSRLGQQVRLLTELGDDAAAVPIRAHLDASGVATVIAPSSVRTPVATAVIGPDGAATYEFDIAWTLEASGLDLDAGHLHTGSIAAHLDPGAAAVTAMVEAARGHATVSYDPNVRPSLVGDRAEVVARTEHLVALSDVVKASDEDLLWLYPGVDTDEAVRAWSLLGPALVVATLGAEGSLACLRGHMIAIAPLHVDVADTVGAGDSYMAALLDGLARARLLGPQGRQELAAVDSATVEDIVSRAARAAAITVSRAGANPPTLTELDGS